MEMLVYIRGREIDGGYRFGDIVEVRPDGYWTKEHGYNGKAFRLVVKKGIPVNNSLMEPGSNGVRRKNKVNFKTFEIIRKESLQI